MACFHPASRRIRPYGPRAARFAVRAPAEDAWLNILVGSVRSGKTWATLPKILQLCEYPVAGHRIITGVSKSAIYQNVLKDLFDIAGRHNCSYNRQSGELKLLGSDWLVIGAKDEGSEKYIRGATVGVAVCDELVLMPRSFFMMLLSRMSQDGARLYGTTNPDNPNHWLKTEVLENKDYIRGLGKDIWTQTWTMDDNPNLGRSARERFKRSYVGVFYKRFILGMWVMAEGAVYRDVLTPETWYTDAQRPNGLTFPGRNRRWISIDVGTVNAFSAIEAYQEGNSLWIENEFYWDSRREGRQKTNAEYADDVVSMIGPCDPRVRPSIIVDPSAASFKAELMSRGLHVVNAKNDVLEGIRKVSTMFGRNRLRLHQRCVNTRRDIENYAWSEKKADNGREQPIKQHDHGADSLRYLVETVMTDWQIAN